MTEAVRQVLQWVGGHPHGAYGAVLLFAFLESLAVVGLVFPGALMMFGAGALVANGTLDFWPTVVAAALGAILGDGISYGFGRRFGDRVRDLWPFSRHPGLLAASERFFERHGGKSIIFARFVGPVRPIMPIVTGILGVPPSRFFLTNALSAIVWAPAYLLPGIAFGMALALAGQIAARLAVLICLVSAIVALVIWLIRLVERHLAPRLADCGVALTDWARQRRGVTRLVADLIDPARSPRRALFAWWGILIAGTWIFFGVLEDVVTRDQLFYAGQSIYDLLRHLRSPIGDRVMIVLTELGDAPVTAPVFLSISLWLLLRRAWRDLAYWIAAIGFGVAFVAVLKWSLHVARPTTIATGLSLYSFPSGHAAMSTIVYGFLAAFIAPAVSFRLRTVVYVLAGVLIAGVSFSRLYLGAHWLADIAGGLGIGMAWVALLTIAHRRHEHAVFSGRRLTALVTAVFIASATVHVRGQFAADRVRYTVRNPILRVPTDEWWQTAWRQLPVYRLDLEGENEQPLNIQYVGTLDALREDLEGAGWRVPGRIGAHGVLSWLAPSPSLADLPVLPKLHNGRTDALRLVHADTAAGAYRDALLILRLWPTELRLTPGDRMLWIGYAGRQRIQRLPLLSLSRSDAGYGPALDALRNDRIRHVEVKTVQRRSIEHDRQPSWNGRVLLLRHETATAEPGCPGEHATNGLL